MLTRMGRRSYRTGRSRRNKTRVPHLRRAHAVQRRVRACAEPRQRPLQIPRRVRPNRRTTRQPQRCYSRTLLPLRPGLRRPMPDVEDVSLRGPGGVEVVAAGPAAVSLRNRRIQHRAH